MRSFAALALISAAAFNTASALVDARERTTVSVKDGSPYDTRTKSKGGCDPHGCVPENTRDQDTSDNSRWSCKKQLENKQCKIKYEFDEPQDIVRLDVQFWKGDERVRKLKVTDDTGFKKTITSSGTSKGFEKFTINTDETETLTLESVGLSKDEWISIKEVKFMVD